jgi:Mg-chelatase subunit ChlD
VRPNDRDDLAEHLNATDDDLDGWELAGALSAGSLAYAGPGARAFAQRLAASAVLRRARALVGPLRAGTRVVLGPWSAGAGELALEATLENILGKEWPEAGDWVVRRRVERRCQVVLMVDTSLSMAGEKMALAAVAVAVLALKLRPGDLSVVLFSDGARVVSRLGEEVRPDDLVRRLLARPCGGATDISTALAAGRVELARGRDPRRSGLLITDGVYTAGPDPCPAAARFRDLHVLLTHDDAAAAGTVWIAPRRNVGEAVARAGNGGIVRVDGFAALPRRMLEVADRVLR